VSGVVTLVPSLIKHLLLLGVGIGEGDSVVPWMGLIRGTVSFCCTHHHDLMMFRRLVRQTTEAELLVAAVCTVCTSRHHSGTRFTEKH
jgi:hypothetical protein